MVDEYPGSERHFGGEYCTETSAPRLCRDIYESNANGLIGELRVKLSKVRNVRASAKAGGDYEHTITAYVRTLHAAILAAEEQMRVEIERDDT